MELMTVQENVRVPSSMGWASMLPTGNMEAKSLHCTGFGFRSMHLAFEADRGRGRTWKSER